MTTSQIEITTSIHAASGLREVKLVDAPDTLSEVQGYDINDGIIVAYAHGQLTDAAVEIICRNALDDALTADDVIDCGELIKQQCNDLDDLQTWYLIEGYRLTDVQEAEWQQAAKDGMFERNPFDGEWQQAIDDLTKLKVEWTAEWMAN